VPIDVVTGAFSYTGSYIAQALLDEARNVRTLSRTPAPPGHPLADRMSRGNLQFSDRRGLVEDLRGAEVLFNTYWIRFPHRNSTFEEAVQNSRTLFEAAQEAGVRRIVHVSVTHATDHPEYPYLRGKAEVERALANVDISSAVVRPSLIFGGRQEILINNLTWLLRRMPVFVIPGDGTYRLQPVAVQDVARLAVRLGKSDERIVVDAVGPEIYTFEEFMRLLNRNAGTHTLFVRAPLSVVLPLTRILGRALRDVLVTENELREMIDEVMLSDAEPTGEVAFSEWLSRQGHAIGRRYAHELHRNWA
jgi:NADH dehydrogenase